MAVRIGNEALNRDDLSDEVNLRNEREKELAHQIEALWQKIEADILRSTFATLVRFLRVRRLLGELIDALSGGATEARGIMGDVNRAFDLEDEQEEVMREKKRFLRLLAEQQRLLRRLINQSETLGCDTPNVALIA